MVNGAFEATLLTMRNKWGSKFVAPITTEMQRVWFNTGRVEVVSPCGYTRRGMISITTGWQPSLMLVHRRNQSGSSDLLNKDDIIVAWIDDRSNRHPIPHDKLQVAVYQAQRETA